MLFRTHQEAEGGLGIDPYQDGIALEDLIEETDADGERSYCWLISGIRNGAPHDVVYGADRDLRPENITQQFDHAADRTMAAEH